MYTPPPPHPPRIRPVYRAISTVLLLCQIAHKHALTLKEAVDFSAWAQRFDHNLHQIINFFAHSVKRSKQLAALAQEYELAHTKVLKMIVTRWLSRGQCVARIFELYRPLLAPLCSEVPGWPTGVQSPAAACRLRDGWGVADHRQKQSTEVADDCASGPS